MRSTPTHASDFRIESREWIVPGHLPLGGVILLAADTGIGKSPLLYHLMACCTALKPFAPNVPVTLDMPLKVLLFNGEGSLRLDVEPLLVAAGADMARITRFDCVVKHAYIDFAKIPDIVSEPASADVVNIDPLTAFE